MGDDMISGYGTPETSWQAWPRLRELPAVSAGELVAEGARVMVVAPHPDDELLAVGGILAQLSERHQEILIIAATDGTASHPGSTIWSPAELGKVRPRETADALQRMGIDAEVMRLGLPDGDVTGFEDILTRHLTETVKGVDVVFSTWRMDGHPDHEAVGRAAAAACAACGVQLIEVPVWTWHWSSPEDPRVPWERAVRIPMSDELHRRKRVAVQAYQSQLMYDEALEIKAVLPAEVLERLLRSYEVVFR